LKKPEGKYSLEQKDQIYDLEKENTTLKSKQNLLEVEILKMNTKLKRIDELMKKKGSDTFSGVLPAEARKHLEDEIRKIDEENEVMK